jgi:hypothetical protein
VLAAGLVAGCTTGVTPHSAPAVWLPDDGLPVPRSVANRDFLQSCGTLVDAPVAAIERASTCLLEALRAGVPAELVLYRPAGHPEGSFLRIVRVGPPGVAEVIHRATAPGMPPLWERELCAGVADGSSPQGSVQMIGRLALTDCGPLVAIGD